MTSLIRTTRLAQNLSVNQLAQRLNVTPSAVSQLERSEREGTIKLNSLREAMSAMNQVLLADASSDYPSAMHSPHRVSSSVAEALLDGDDTFALRLLSQAAQEISENPDGFRREDLERAPGRLPDPRWDAFMRAFLGHVIPRPKPAWVKTQKLSEPWFVSQFSSLRERAKETTPSYLANLNIFIDAKSLSGL